MRFQFWLLAVAPWFVCSLPTGDRGMKQGEDTRPLSSDDPSQMRKKTEQRLAAENEVELKGGPQVDIIMVDEEKAHSVVGKPDTNGEMFDRRRGDALPEETISTPVDKVQSEQTDDVTDEGTKTEKTDESVTVTSARPHSEQPDKIGDVEPDSDDGGTADETKVTNTVESDDLASDVETTLMNDFHDDVEFTTTTPFAKPASDVTDTAAEVTSDADTYGEVFDRRRGDALPEETISTPVDKVQSEQTDDVTDEGTKTEKTDESVTVTSARPHSVQPDKIGDVQPDSDDDGTTDETKVTNTVESDDLASDVETTLMNDFYDDVGFTTTTPFAKPASDVTDTAAEVTPDADTYGEVFDRRRGDALPEETISTPVDKVQSEQTDDGTDEGTKTEKTDESVTVTSVRPHNVQPDKIGDVEPDSDDGGTTDETKVTNTVESDDLASDVETTLMNDFYDDVEFTTTTPFAKPASDVTDTAAEVTPDAGRTQENAPAEQGPTSSETYDHIDAIIQVQLLPDPRHCEEEHHSLRDSPPSQVSREKSSEGHQHVWENVREASVEDSDYAYEDHDDWSPFDMFSSPSFRMSLPSVFHSRSDEGRYDSFLPEYAVNSPENSLQEVSFDDYSDSSSPYLMFRAMMGGSPRFTHAETRLQHSDNPDPFRAHSSLFGSSGKGHENVVEDHNDPALRHDLSSQPRDPSPEHEMEAGARDAHDKQEQVPTDSDTTPPQSGVEDQIPDLFSVYLRSAMKGLASRFSFVAFDPRTD